MDEHPGQRFSGRRTSLFGSKGFRKDPGPQTTIATLVAVVNFSLLAYTIDQMGYFDDLGRFHIHASFGKGLYVLATLTVVVSVLSAFLIRYRSTAARWGARVIACGLPASAVLITAALWSR